MSKGEKPNKFESIMRLLESNGGPVLAFLALLAFIAYLTYAHFHPTNAVVETLERHGSAAQVVSVAFVLLVALAAWGYRKMLFKIAERERLREHNAELEDSNAQWQQRFTQSEARNAELEGRNAELEARIAELENERQPPPDQEEQH